MHCAMATGGPAKVMCGLVQLPLLRLTAARAQEQERALLAAAASAVERRLYVSLYVPDPPPASLAAAGLPGGGVAMHCHVAPRHSPNN